MVIGAVIVVVVVVKSHLFYLCSTKGSKDVTLHWSDLTLYFPNERKKKERFPSASTSRGSQSEPRVVLETMETRPRKVCPLPLH